MAERALSRKRAERPPDRRRWSRGWYGNPHRRVPRPGPKPLRAATPFPEVTPFVSLALGSPPLHLSPAYYLSRSNSLRSRISASLFFFLFQLLPGPLHHYGNTHFLSVVEKPALSTFFLWSRFLLLHPEFYLTSQAQPAFPDYSTTQIGFSHTVDPDRPRLAPRDTTRERKRCRKKLKWRAREIYSHATGILPFFALHYIRECRSIPLWTI